MQPNLINNLAGKTFVANQEVSKEIVRVLSAHGINAWYNSAEVEAANRAGVVVGSTNAATLVTLIESLQNHGFVLVQVNWSSNCYELAFAANLNGALTVQRVRGSIRPTHFGIPLQRSKTRPQGLFVILLGPDGVGKSTLAQRLVAGLEPLFRKSKIFHWRPGVLGHSSNNGKPLGEPYFLRPRRALLSTLFLTFFCVDYWVGYFAIERKLLAAPGLVIFDRYLHDLMLDPKRYRYQGPMYLCRAMCSMVPPKDALILVLDADEQTIWARKKDLSIEQLKIQRAEYIQFAKNWRHTVLIDSSRGIEQMACAAFDVVLKRLRDKARGAADELQRILLRADQEL